MRYTWRVMAITAILGLFTLTLVVAHPRPFQSATGHLSASASYGSVLGNRMLDAAETRTGSWYSYGSAGPSYFDCSGLVSWAAGQVGVSLPHSTYAMLAGTAHLYRISLSQVRRGDLLFFGSGHVEIATRWYHVSFGAHHSGTRVGWRHWSGYYAPTMAMRLSLRGDPPRLGRPLSWVQPWHRPPG